MEGFYWIQWTRYFMKLLFNLTSFIFVIHLTPLQLLRLVNLYNVVFATASTLIYWRLVRNILTIFFFYRKNDFFPLKIWRWNSSYYCCLRHPRGMGVPWGYKKTLLLVICSFHIHESTYLLFFLVIYKSLLLVYLLWSLKFQKRTGIFLVFFKYTDILRWGYCRIWIVAKTWMIINGILALGLLWSWIVWNNRILLKIQDSLWLWWQIVLTEPTLLIKLIS